MLIWLFFVDNTTATELIPLSLVHVNGVINTVKLWAFPLVVIWIINIIDTGSYFKVMSSSPTSHEVTSFFLFDGVYSVLSQGGTTGFTTFFT